MQIDPTGTHTRFEPGYNMLDYCKGPVLLYYADDRLSSWWGNLLPLQKKGLSACATPCMITSNISEADILVGALQPPALDRPKEWWQRIAVVNLEAHSISRDSAARTDILVSFHAQADVVVNYFYALRHGLPCRDAAHCLHRAVRESVGPAPRPPPRPRAKAAMFVSARCDRFNRFLPALIARIMRPLGVDSFGRCDHNRREADDPLWDPANPAASKERIASQYRFLLVAENEVLDDYVTEKFYEGLKSGALMVYLGAPNAARYAPWPRAYVDALQFPGPAALGDYLVELDRNASLYASYFRARRAPGAPPSAAFELLAERDFARADGHSWQCRVCRAYARGFCRGGVVAGR